MAGLSTTGQVTLLTDARAKSFDRQVTVGYIYMLKLHHSGRRQDPRPVRRTLLARYPASAGRQGAVRRSALRRGWRSGRLKPTARPYTLQEMLTVQVG